ncbi:flagellar biosynthetic protein FliO [Rhizobium sp. 18065]|uniref:flagellar biosynthetic protein FliO n=1 Tax=Rhizobium sp. 18065 TaxID=2681411 RepID=UPI00135BA89E|nr:flagellar biosynthetic protein FliO [Rhizobium sp. 18065]
MLDELISAYGNRLLVAALGVALALLCLFIVLWLMRNRASSPFVRGGRNRQPRLQVLDAAAVDARRRIVLIRRDNVEHLVMIGGPTDIVIESGIGDDRAYLSALAVQAQASETSPTLPPAGTARIVTAPVEPEPVVKPARPVQAATAAERTIAEQEPVRSKPQPAPMHVAPVAPVLTAQQNSATTAQKAPMTAGAPIAQPASAAQATVIPLTAASVAPIVASATIPVMTAPATPQIQTPMPTPVARDEAKPLDPVRPPSAPIPAEPRQEPRLDVVASPVPPAPPVAIAPVVETARSASIQAPIEIASPTAPTEAYASIAIVPEVSSEGSHEGSYEPQREPQFEQPTNIGSAPEVASIASHTVPDMPVIQIPSVDIAAEATSFHAPEVTAPDAANILEAARARVLPMNAERPDAAQPFAAERFAPQHEPFNAAEKQEPPRDMSDFERVLEEEMALHLAADPLPLPQASNLKGDSPMTQPFLPEIRSDRPGLPISAILPENRHVTPPAAKPATDAKPDEPNLQNEIARIFGEMSASRNS